MLYFHPKDLHITNNNITTANKTFPDTYQKPSADDLVKYDIEWICIVCIVYKRVTYVAKAYLLKRSFRCNSDIQ